MFELFYAHRIVKYFSYSGFRRHLQLAASLMVCTSKTIINYPFDTYIQIRTALHHLANRHLNLRNWTKICEGILNKKVTCDFDGEEYDLFGVLFYLMDGFLPMMRSFLSQYWVKNTPSSMAEVVTQFFPILKVYNGIQVSMSEKYETNVISCIILDYNTFC